MGPCSGGSRGHDPQYRRTERSQGQFYRRFVLPNTVDSDKVNAAGKDGVLTVTIPKKAGISDLHAARAPAQKRHAANYSSGVRPAT
ncbi:MAG: Hsp20/alpha crystallin family protein [Pseudomonadota bacterium]